IYFVYPLFFEAAFCKVSPFFIRDFLRLLYRFIANKYSYILTLFRFSATTKKTKKRKKRQKTNFSQSSLTPLKQSVENFS
ncbi:MAG: hypothetical protein LBR61_07730, partial [Synergistaceae bacterium]|nr:hypothetical protein [Synergistaceae bacterium]